MPYKHERDREKLREYAQAARDHGGLTEQSFPVKDPANPQGIDPRQVSRTVVVTETTLIGFGPLGGMYT